MQFSGSCYFSLIFIFHIDIVYECIVLRCIVENKLTYLLTYYYIPSLKEVLERLRSCCGFVIKSLYNLLISLHTKYNTDMLIQQRMYASIRKTVKKKLIIIFLHFSCKDNTISHIVIHIIIGMFNSNPMIPQYLQLVEYSQRYSQLC